MTIVYTGINFFPYGFAAGERIKLISKALVEEGNQVFVICRKGGLTNRSARVPYKGVVEGINYIYTSGTAYKSSNFLIRNFLKIPGAAGEFIYLLWLRLHRPIDFMIAYTRDLTLLKYYHFLSLFLGFRLITDYTEKASSWTIEGANDFQKFEQQSPFLVHGAFSISGYLEDFIKQVNPNLPVIKVPVLCDYQKLDEVEPFYNQDEYFLFCGTLFYLEIIEFIIDSFMKCQRSGIKLYLVVNGRSEEYDRLNFLLEKYPKRDSIVVFSQLEYHQLISMYKGSIALLIPLRPTIQDIARFPHKIGEYTASGRPMVTTGYGEISEYFTDGENALIASEFTIEQFAHKMEFTLLNPEEASRIGANGKMVSAREFNYRIIGEHIVQFLKQLQ